MISVAVIGCCGKMGSEVVRAIAKEPDMLVSAAIDVVNFGQDIGVKAGLPPTGVLIENDLAPALKSARPDVAVDFTLAKAARESISQALRIPRMSDAFFAYPCSSRNYRLV